MCPSENKEYVNNPAKANGHSSKFWVKTMLINLPQKKQKDRKVNPSDELAFTFYSYNLSISMGVAISYPKIGQAPPVGLWWMAQSRCKLLRG